MNANEAITRSNHRVHSLHGQESSVQSLRREEAGQRYALFKEQLFGLLLVQKAGYQINQAGDKLQTSPTLVVHKIGAIALPFIAVRFECDLGETRYPTPNEKMVLNGRAAGVNGLEAQWAHYAAVDYMTAAFTVPYPDDDDIALSVGEVYETEPFSEQDLDELALPTVQGRVDNIRASLRTYSRVLRHNVHYEVA